MFLATIVFLKKKKNWECKSQWMFLNILASVLYFNKHEKAKFLNDLN